MEIQEGLLNEKKDFVNIQKGSTEKGSIQYNAQDLQQEQKCDMNPVQTNTQNIHIHLSNERLTLASKITGITVVDDNQRILPNADICLFFGHESTCPVYITRSDDNGSFTIEDIPPGYYTLHAHHGDHLECLSHVIKVLPGQNTYEYILLL